MDNLKPIASAGQFWRLKSGEIAFITSLSDQPTSHPISGQVVGTNTFEMWTDAGHIVLDIEDQFSPRDLDVQLELLETSTELFQEQVELTLTNLYADVQSVIVAIQRVVDLYSDLTGKVDSLLAAQRPNGLATPKDIQPEQYWLTVSGWVVQILETKAKSMKPVVVKPVDPDLEPYSLRSDGTMSNTGVSDPKDLHQLISPSHVQGWAGETQPQNLPAGASDVLRSWDGVPADGKFWEGAESRLYRSRAGGGLDVEVFNIAMASADVAAPAGNIVRYTGTDALPAKGTLEMLQESVTQPISTGGCGGELTLPAMPWTARGR